MKLFLCYFDNYKSSVTLSTNHFYSILQEFAVSLATLRFLSHSVLSLIMWARRIGENKSFKSLAYRPFRTWKNRIKVPGLIRTLARYIRVRHCRTARGDGRNLTFFFFFFNPLFFSFFSFFFIVPFIIILCPAAAAAYTFTRTAIILLLLFSSGVRVAPARQ